MLRWKLKSLEKVLVCNILRGRRGLLKILVNSGMSTDGAKFRKNYLKFGRKWWVLTWEGVVELKHCTVYDGGEEMS